MKVIEIGQGKSKRTFQLHADGSANIIEPGAVYRCYSKRDMEELRDALNTQYPPPAEPSVPEPQEYYVRPHNGLYEVCMDVSLAVRPVTSTKVISRSNFEDDAKSIAQALNESAGL